MKTHREKNFHNENYKLCCSIVRSSHLIANFMAIIGLFSNVNNRFCQCIDIDGEKPNSEYNLHFSVNLSYSIVILNANCSLSNFEMNVGKQRKENKVLCKKIRTRRKRFSQLSKKKVYSLWIHFFCSGWLLFFSGCRKVKNEENFWRQNKKVRKIIKKTVFFCIFNIFLFKLHIKFV